MKPGPEVFYIHENNVILQKLRMTTQIVHNNI